MSCKLTLDPFDDIDWLFHLPSISIFSSSVKIHLPFHVSQLKPVTSRSWWTGRSTRESHTRSSWTLPSLWSSTGSIWTNLEGCLGLSVQEGIMSGLQAGWFVLQINIFTVRWQKWEAMKCKYFIIVLVHFQVSVLYFSIYCSANFLLLLPMSFHKYVNLVLLTFSKEAHYCSFNAFQVSFYFPALCVF